MKKHHTPRARDLRRNETEAERKLWAQIRNRQIDGWKFRRQVPHGRFILDFFCFEAALVIEVDGSQHADMRLQSDIARTALLENDGLRVLRFWNGDVLDNMDGVLEAIYVALGQSAAPTLGRLKRQVPKSKFEKENE